MPLFRKVWLAAVLAVQVLALPLAQAAPRPPLVLAGSSLQEALNEAADAWAAKRHARPVLSFAASSALARQIEAGAPADLFISADEAWMDYVMGKGLTRRGTRAPLVGNRLVLIAPADSKLHLTIAPGFPLARALGDGRLAMADPDAVPAGKYGKAALTGLGVWPQVSGRIARAENVRAALALVERGAAPLGIVYASDAATSRAVRVLGRFAATSHAPITYPVVVLRAATSPDTAGFRRFLLSAEGQVIFARRGFVTHSGGQRP